MKRLSAVLLAAALFVVATQAQTRRIDPRAYLEHVKFLASDDLEGRGNGSPGLEAAADYIAQTVPRSRARAGRVTRERSFSDSR